MILIAYQSQVEFDEFVTDSRGRENPEVGEKEGDTVGRGVVNVRVGVSH